MIRGIISGMELSVRIAAHPKRELWATELSRALDAPITWDEQNNVWHTHRRALLSASGDYVMVIQDDAVLSEGLVESVTKAIHHADGEPISLYAWPTKTVTGIVNLNPVTWWRMLGPLFGVAVVLPVEDVVPIVQHGDIYRGPSYDRRLWRWYQIQKRLCRYTFPCLVEHRDEPSLMWTTPRPHRKALAFGSGLDLDWTVPPLDATHDVRSPKVILVQDGREVTVRKYTSIWRRRVAAGWVEK